MKIAIIGGGAAGFFAAIQVATQYPDYQVIIFEKTSKLLAKVKVSGGGRCNVSHACFQKNDLAKYYPRGEKFLKQAFSVFMPQDMMAWLEKRGVKLKIEPDGRIFPQSDDSQTIIDAFLYETQKLKIVIQIQAEVNQLIPQTDGKILLKLKEQKDFLADKVIVTTGGSPKLSGLDWLSDLGHTIEPPLPSLFTFNLPENPIRTLMGVAVEKAKVRVQSTKLSETGALLITHWGMSGPAILKLSAWGARDLSNLNYHFIIRINWVADMAESDVLPALQNVKNSNQQKISNFIPFPLPKRLWFFLLEKTKINPEKRWNELAKAEINRLTEFLINDDYEVKGKTTFKEEFVTCGGISLKDIEVTTMQSKKVPNLYFAGEVMDIDGVTGGFNFQAAWTTAFIAGQLK